MRYIAELYLTTSELIMNIGLAGVYVFFRLMFFFNQMLEYTFSENNIEVSPTLPTGLYFLFLASLFASGIVYLALLGKKAFELFYKKNIVISKKTLIKCWVLLTLLTAIFYDLTSNSVLYYIPGFLELTSYVIFPLSGLGLTAAIVALLNFLIKFVLGLVKKNFHRTKLINIILTAITIIAVAYPLLTFVSVLIWFTSDDNPQGSRYHTLHAAIKNTCLSDPEKQNCPQKTEEIGYVEPKKFQEALDCCQVNYAYNPADNSYTLVVRYQPKQAVVFDQRLIEMDSWGLDFKEYEVELIGQDRLKNAPNWDGPWTFEDWNY